MIEKSMNKNFIGKQKIVLEDELKKLEEQFRLTRAFPEYGTSEDENIQEVERFQENLSLQNNLKNLIKDTKTALKNIEKDKYGKCAICSNQIETGRLKIHPSALLCVSCSSKRRK